MLFWAIMKSSNHQLMLQCPLTCIPASMSAVSHSTQLLMATSKMNTSCYGIAKLISCTPNKRRKNSKEYEVVLMHINVA